MRRRTRSPLRSEKSLIVVTWTFAALLPVNGGRDPQTGKAFVSMDVIITLFGQTLAGERVSGSTKFPLTFCFDCNGCK